MKLPYHVIAIPGVWMAMKGPRGKRVLSEFFDKFVMQDARGDHRKCLVFFDNDKAYNVNVTQAIGRSPPPACRRRAEMFSYRTCHSARR